MIGQVTHSSTNYYSRGDVTYGDTFWEDLRFPLTKSSQGTNDLPDFDATDMCLLFPDDQDTSGATAEITYHNVQMPHAWDTSTLISPHLHWLQSSSDTVAFRCLWRVLPLNGAPSSWTYGNTVDSDAFAYTSGTLHQLLSFEDIDITGYSESSIVQIKIYRIDDGGVGALTGDCKVVEFDIHYEINKPGSDNEAP